MGLDINTPAGQKTLQEEQEAYDLYRLHNSSARIIETNKRGSAPVDCVVASNGQLQAVVETKCRQMTWQMLKKYGTWLITHERLVKGAKAAELLQVPYCGFLYLVPDKKLCIWKIADAYGNWIFEFESRTSKTQMTVNGGTAYRKNAFLPTKHIAQIYE